MSKKIAIIGMGHMGKALYGGLIFAGVKKENILVSNNSVDNKKIVTDADWIVLAVKPSVVSQVITEIKDVVSEKLFFSVAAGVSIEAISKQLDNTEQNIIRLMPNLSVAYGQGVIGFFASDSVSDLQKNEVTTLLSDLGKVIICKEEEQIDAMTILSGSGPAVIAYFISLLEQSAESFGFDKIDATMISNQTFAGTLALLKQTNQTAKELQDAVATKGGTTEAIIESLEEEQIAKSFQKSLEVGYDRIKEIKNI